MKKLMIAFLAVGSLFAFAGCKKKGGGGDTVEKMEGFQKQMCDCKDKACADKVQEEMTKWGTEMAKNAGDKGEKPDPEMVKKTTEIMGKYTECMTKLMMAGAGGDMAGSDKAGGDTAGSDKAGGDDGSAAAGGSDDGSAAAGGDDDKKDDGAGGDEKKDEGAGDDKK